jgi:hypothetical protein
MTMMQKTVDRFTVQRADAGDKEAMAEFIAYARREREESLDLLRRAGLVKIRHGDPDWSAIKRTDEKPNHVGAAWRCLYESDFRERYTAWVKSEGAGTIFVLDGDDVRAITPS